MGPRLEIFSVMKSLVILCFVSFITMIQEIISILLKLVIQVSLSVIPENIEYKDVALCYIDIILLIRLP